MEGCLPKNRIFIGNKKGGTVIRQTLLNTFSFTAHTQQSYGLTYFSGEVFQGIFDLLYP